MSFSRSSIAPDFGSEIVFRISEAGVTTNRCSDRCFTIIDGVRFEAKSGRGASHKLARMLVAAGVPDSLWVVVREETGTRAISGRSFYQLAQWTVSEPDRSGPKFTKFVEHPMVGTAA